MVNTFRRVQDIEEDKMSDKKHSLSLRLMQFLWLGEVLILIVVGIILIFALHARVSAYCQMLPYLSGLIAGQGACAFGGPQLKNHFKSKSKQ